MTPAALRVLKELAEDSGLDIACSGIECFCGDRRISRRTVTHLLRLTAIKSPGWESANSEYYIINETGRRILRRPEIEDEIRAALAGNRSFTITADDRIEFL